MQSERCGAIGELPSAAEGRSSATRFLMAQQSRCAGEKKSGQQVGEQSVGGTRRRRDNTGQRVKDRLSVQTVSRRRQDCALLDIYVTYVMVRVVLKAVERTSGCLHAL